MTAAPNASEATPDYPGALRLDGRGFVVLGAGQGMGAQSCYALRQAGADLLCVDSDAGRATAIARETGGEALVADVTKRVDMAAVFDRASVLFGGEFTGVVDIVGIAGTSPIAAITDESWAFQYDIVLKHALYALQIAAPMLARNGGGSMTFIGSISGAVAIANQSAYGSAKAALHHLIRMAALEFGPQGVRVNGIAPGIVRTPRLENILGTEAWKSLAEINWLGRVADPSDIARVVLFLASGLAQYVNGNILMLDGGISNGVPMTIPRR
ncbi:MAG: SDR family oxidoreductase [Rhizomicrobium sp.]